MKLMRYKKTLLSVALSCSAFFAIQANSAYAKNETETNEVTITTQYGDVNFDKSVGISDAVQLQRFLLGQSEELGNWKNADLNEDGDVDIFDFNLLRKQLTGQITYKGGNLSVKVVDMMTGEPLDSAEVQIHGICGDYYYDLADWDYTPDDHKLFTGLPTDKKYEYMIELKNLPDGYGTDYRDWDQQLVFSYDGEKEKELTIRVRSNKTENNVKINMFDWSLEADIPYCPVLTVTDKDGNPYYPTMHYEDIALPDGEYHVDIKLFDYSVEILGPNSKFAKAIKKIYPHIEFSDKSNGIDFTVKNGKTDKEIHFDFSPIKEKSNSLIVNCIDSITGEPLEGVEISLIEAPETYAEKIATLTSDSTGTVTFDDLFHAGYINTHAYKIQVDKVPDGYSGGYDKYISWGYVYGYSDEVTYSFVPDSAQEKISVDIINWDDKSIINDVATFDIWHISDGISWIGKSEEVLKDVKAGEDFVLPDGEYLASLNRNEAKDNGYKSIRFYTKKGRDLFKDISIDDFVGDSSIIRFTVKDGKVDRELSFYLQSNDSDDEISFFENTKLGESIRDSVSDLLNDLGVKRR